MAERSSGEEAGRGPGRAGRAVRDQLSAQRVFGERIELDGVTIIPVAAVHCCRCRKSGDGEGEGCGFSSTRPVGLVVIRDGYVGWKPTLDLSRLALIGAAALGLFTLLRHRR
ncbi:MAG: hypothetical protein WBQ14_01975 [Gaiellaceae bacterium]